MKRRLRAVRKYTCLHTEVSNAHAAVQSSTSDAPQIRRPADGEWRKGCSVTARSKSNGACGSRFARCGSSTLLRECSATPLDSQNSGQISSTLHHVAIRQIRWVQTRFHLDPFHEPAHPFLIKPKISLDFLNPRVQMLFIGLDFFLTLLYPLLQSFSQQLILQFAAKSSSVLPTRPPCVLLIADQDPPQSD